MMGGASNTTRLRELLGIMQRLRAADGCPWDRQQTFATIAPYTIEEAYEVADAAERGDMQHLKDELGDLLFQVVFHAQMAHEAGHFDFDAVAGAICDKLLRRHPHVFGDAGPMTPTEQSAMWEKIKAAERSAASAAAAESADGIAGGGRVRGAKDAVIAEAAGHSHLGGIPQALPALMRADKLSKRAARVGFDFEYARQSAEKVTEELAEVLHAAGEGEPANGSSRKVFEEVGDLLFAAANLARKLDVDAEAALRSANAKFERRFRGMEFLAAQRGQIFADLNLDAQERLWQEVKRGE
jgi:MazG family protein